MVVQRNMNRLSIVQIPSDIANKIEHGRNGSKRQKVVAFIMRCCLFQEVNEAHRWVHLRKLAGWMTGLQYISVFPLDFWSNFRFWKFPQVVSELFFIICKHFMGSPFVDSTALKSCLEKKKKTSIPLYVLYSSWSSVWKTEQGEWIIWKYRLIVGITLCLITV